MTMIRLLQLVIFYITLFGQKHFFVTGNTVNLTIDKDQYVTGDTIKVTGSVSVTATGITSNDNSQEGLFTIILCKDIPTFTGSTNQYILDRFYTEYFDNNTSASSFLVVDMNEVVLLPSRSERTYKNKTNVTVLDFAPKPLVNQSFCVVLVNDAFTKIVASSKPITFVLKEEILQLNTSYYTGEYFFLSSSTTIGPDYYKVFSLNNTSQNNTIVGVKDDPFKLNKLPFRFFNLDLDYDKPLGMDKLIGWRRPGFYQIATFVGSHHPLYLGNNEVIKGISNVFEIKPQDTLSKTIVRTNVLNYYPGEIINLTVTRLAGTPFNREFTFRLVPANATTEQDYEISESLNHLMKGDRAIWTSNTTTMVFTPKIRLLESGLYKMAIYLDYNYRLGVSNIFKVRKGLIRVTMPKREYKIGELAFITVFNPLFNLEADKFIPWYGYEFAAAIALPNTTNSNNNTDIRKIYSYNNNPTSFRVTEFYEVGSIYRLVINQFSNRTNKIVLSIPNTTFRVI